MADTSLANYFNIAPSSTTWGLGQNALVQALPLLMQTRGTPNQQFGTALGMSLVSALLGYQARRSAAQQSLEAAGLGQQMLKLQTPEERLGFIQNVGDSTAQERLLGLNTKLAEQELTNKLAREQKISDFETSAGLELGPLGQALFQRKQEQLATSEIAKAKALQEFYASPEGEKAREFELQKIREEAAARRTPLEEILAREAAKKDTGLSIEEKRQQGRLQLQVEKQLGAKELQGLRAQAVAGDADAQRLFDAKEAQLNREHQATISRMKIEMGADKALELQQRMAASELEMVQSGTDPKLARSLALLKANKDSQAELPEIKLSPAEKSKLESNLTFAELAKEHRDRIASMPTVALKSALTSGTNLFGATPGFIEQNEAVLQVYRKANFGATLTGNEKKAADIIAGKNLTATKDDILAAWDTLINQSAKRATNTLKVATKTPSELINELSGGGGGNASSTKQSGNPMEIAAEDFLSRLKARYGAEWVTKATDAERQTAKALREAAGR